MTIVSKENLCLYGLIVVGFLILILLIVKSIFYYDLQAEMERRRIEKIQCSRIGSDLQCVVYGNDEQIAFEYLIESSKYSGEDQIICIADNPMEKLANQPGAYADMKKLIWAFDAIRNDKEQITIKEVDNVQNSK